MMFDNNDVPEIREVRIKQSQGLLSYLSEEFGDGIDRVAERTGVGHDTLNSVDKGLGPLAIGQMKDIAEAYGFSFSELLALSFDHDFPDADRNDPIYKGLMGVLFHPVHYGCD